MVPYGFLTPRVLYSLTAECLTFAKVRHLLRRPGFKGSLEACSRARIAVQDVGPNKGRIGRVQEANRLLDHPRAEVHVPLRGEEILVPGQLPNGPGRSPRHREVGAEAVPQRTWIREPPSCSSPPSRPADGRADPEPGVRCALLSLRSRCWQSRSGSDPLYDIARAAIHLPTRRDRSATSTTIGFADTLGSPSDPGRVPGPPEGTAAVTILSRALLESHQRR
jgi:hypothetical protein